MQTQQQLVPTDGEQHEQKEHWRRQTAMVEGRRPRPMTVSEEATEALHLVSGVVQDAKRLASAYGELFKHDLRTEIDRGKRAVIAGSIAAYTAGAGILLLAMAAAHGLSLWLEWTLALGYAVVGSVVALIAVVALWRMRQATDEVAPPEAVSEAKEDARWLKENI